MITFPAFKKWVSITKSDTVNFEFQNGKPCPDAIYIGGAGNIVLVLEDGTTLTVAVAAGSYIWNNGVKRVNSTSTTATGMFALYTL